MKGVLSDERDAAGGTVVLVTVQVNLAKEI